MRGDLTFERQTRVDSSAADLYSWHIRPGAFERLAPPWQRVEIVGGSTAVADGSRLVLRMGKGPLRFRWVAEHGQVRPGAGFRDVQVRGPFALWQHDHLFQPLAPGGALLRDRILYRPPGGALGRLLMGPTLAGDLERTFRYRHATTAADLEMHGRHAGQPRLRVAISGAGGLIGRALAAMLSTGGHRVVRLTRSADSDGDSIPWNPSVGILEPSRAEGLDAIIHLAGENVAGGRWSAARRRRIRNRRVQGTHNLVASLDRLDQPPRSFISASAIGYYGDRGDTRLDESATTGSGFLAEVCSAWEEAALAAGDLGCRVALARLGVVLSPAGGFLRSVLTPFRFGLGGRLGDGRQKVSWISIDDAAAALIHLLMSPNLEGPFNLATPQAPSNSELTGVLAGVLRRPAALPLPAAVARAACGEMAQETMLASVWAHPARLLAGGFRFRHPDLEPALRHLLGLPETR